MPAVLVELTAVPGLGPKRVKALYDTLDVRGVEDLERAAHSGRIAGIRGFGAKTIERILHALEARRGSEGRVMWLEAERADAPLVEQVRAAPGVEDAVVAGGLRRGRETVGRYLEEVSSAPWWFPCAVLFRRRNG